MEWIDIKRDEPYHDGFYDLKTSKGRELIGEYLYEFGIFMIEREEDGKEYEMGWKNNGENPEVVTHYRKANLCIECKLPVGDCLCGGSF